MENRIGDARRDYATLVGGFTQKDAAEYFGVSLSTYKKWEQGQGMMNGSQLRAIAEKYMTTVDYLLMLTDNPEPLDESPAPAPAPSPALSREEAELLGLWRRMDAQSRDAILVMARNAAAMSGVRQDVAGRVGAVR